MTLRLLLSLPTKTKTKRATLLFSSSSSSPRRRRFSSSSSFSTTREKKTKKKKKKKKNKSSSSFFSSFFLSRSLSLSCQSVFRCFVFCVFTTSFVTQRREFFCVRSKKECARLKDEINERKTRETLAKKKTVLSVFFSFALRRRFLSSLLLLLLLLFFCSRDDDDGRDLHSQQSRRK